MNNTPESENTMETAVRPSSLADVASANGKVPGTRALGTGLETRGIHAWFGKHSQEHLGLWKQFLQGASRS